MSYDLTNMLRDWPYEPGQLAVRMLDGDDGRSKIQMRLDLGILQMEIDGRPDGHRPDGHDSYLEQYESFMDEHQAIGDSPEDFALDAEACRRLRDEAVQYYQRYVALFVLEEFEGVVRDTSRNLRVVNFCSEFAEDDDDREMLEQFRPYLLMMRARALAGQAVADHEPKAALLAIDQALDGIRECVDDKEFQRSSEVALLNGMRDALAPKLPVSARAELRARMKQAVELENYELAAILRDELRNMPD